jgi:hypothetical protein
MDRTKNIIRGLPTLGARPVKSKPRVPGKGSPAGRPADLNPQQRLKEISVLSQVAQSMAQLMELDELWPRLQREVNRLMDAGNFYVALWHRRENEVEFVYEIEGGKLIPKSRKSRIRSYFRQTAAVEKPGSKKAGEAVQNAGQTGPVLAGSSHQA